MCNTSQTHLQCKLLVQALLHSVPEEISKDKNNPTVGSDMTSKNILLPLILGKTVAAFYTNDN